MALTERVVIGSRNVLESGAIEVRSDTVIERDGIEISRTYYRYVLAPGDPITGQDASVQRIAVAEHTPAKIAAYKLAMEKVT